MRFSIERRDGYLHATLFGRDTAEEMRDFLLAVHAACQEHGIPKILMTVRQSRAVFKPEDYGLNGYVKDLVTPACQIALVGDTDEVNAANEYIEVVARQQGVNVHAFRNESAALRWMSGAALPTRRYRFTRIVIAGAPEDAGIYTLWDGEEVIYYGRADGRNAGGGSTIRSRLLDHYYANPQRPTHYSWELCGNPASREAELLQEHERAFGRLPRYNQDKAA
jgi:hypothetical protein